MKKNKGRPAIVRIIFLTFITALTWVGFELYGILSKPAQLTDPGQEVLNPLDPQLDTQTLENLTLRTYLNPAQIEANLLVEPTPEPTPEPTNTPIPENE